MANGYRDYSNSPDWAGALSNLSAIIQQSQGRQQQNKQFGMQMQMQQQNAMQQQKRFDAEMSYKNQQAIAEGDRWKQSFEETQKVNAIEMDKLNAALDIMKMETESTKKRQEAITIMGAEAGLEGVSQYQTPEQWSEHPGIREAGLSGVVLSLGDEGLSGFVKEEGAGYDAALDVYNRAQLGESFESLGVDESLRGIYDTAVEDKARGVRRDEAQIRAMSGGNRGLSGPSTPEQPNIFDAMKQIDQLDKVIEFKKMEGLDTSVEESMRKLMMGQIGSPKSDTDPGPGGGDGTGTQMQAGGVDWNTWLPELLTEFNPEGIADNMGLFKDASGAIKGMLERLDKAVGDASSVGGMPESVALEVNNLRNELQSRYDALQEFKGTT